MDFSRTTPLSSQGIDGRFGNINQVCYSANLNLPHDMSVMHLAERRRAQQLKVPTAGAYHKAENDEDQWGCDDGSPKSAGNQRVRQSLAGKVNQKVLTSPRDIKFRGTADLSGSG